MIPGENFIIPFCYCARIMEERKGGGGSRPSYEQRIYCAISRNISLGPLNRRLFLPDTSTRFPTFTP